MGRKKIIERIIYEATIEYLNENITRKKQNENELTDEINAIKTHIIFELNGDDPNYGDDDLISGDCWKLTSLMHHMNNIKNVHYMKLLNLCEGQGTNTCVVEHWFLEYNGKYYDGWNTEGVNNVCELEYCRRNYLPDYYEFIKNIIPDNVSYKQYCDMCAIEDERPDVFEMVIPKTGQAKERQDWFDTMTQLKKNNKAF